MRNKINKFSENLLRLMILERVNQLEQEDKSLNVLKKQAELLEMVDELILIANSSPRGLVEVVITDEKFNDRTLPGEILKNAVCKVTFFNSIDRKGILFRTVIILDPYWSNNFTVFQSQYGFENNTLRLVSD